MWEKNAIPLFKIPFNRNAAGLSFLLAEASATAFLNRYNGAILI
jgi:hypothetical protein